MMKTERLERFLFMIKQDVRLTSGDGGCGGGSEPIKWTESVREAAPGKTGPRTADTNYLAVRQDSQARVFSIPAERVLKAARGIASITDQRSPVPTTLPITNVGGGEVTRCVTIEPGCRHAGWPRLHVSFSNNLFLALFLCLSCVMLHARLTACCPCGFTILQYPLVRHSSSSG